MKKYIIHLIVFTIVLGFASLAHAAAGPEDLNGLMTDVYMALQGGDYVIAAVAGVVFLASVFRRYGGTYVSWLTHELIGPLLVIATSVGFSALSALQAGEDFGLKDLYTALLVAGGAGGLYSMLKPYISFVEGKAPVYLKPLFALLNIVFKAKNEAKLQYAARQGLKAVKENPAKGFDIDVKKID